MEFRFLHEKGYWVWLEARGRNLLHHPQLAGIIVNSRDINARKKTEGDLEKSEKKFKKLVDNSISLIMEIDANSHILLNCNPAMARHLNTEPKKIIGQKISDYFPAEIYEQRMNYGKKALEENKVQQFEDQRDGQFYLHNIIPLTDGLKQSVQCVSYNITELKKTQLKLQESREKYKNLFEQSSIGLAIIAPEGKLIDANQELCSMLGYPKENLLGKTIQDISFVAMENEELQQLEAQQKGEKDNINIDKLFLDNNGSSFWGNLHSHAVRDVEGRIKYILAAVTDISERKKAESTLEESLIDLTLAQEIAKIGNWKFDPAIGIPQWSEYVYEIFQRDPSNAVPSIDEYKKIHGEKQYQIFQEAIQKAINEGVSFDICLKIELENNKQKWIRVICKPGPKKNNAGYLLRGTIQDISQQKEAEIKLQQSESRMRELNATKDKFFSIIGHDLRNPFMGIKGLANCILKKIHNKNYDKLEELIEQIDKSSEQSLNLLENILQWSRLQTGRMTCRSIKINLNEAAMEAAIFYKINLEEKNLHIQHKIPNKLFVQADPFMLQTILRNLIYNAIKYSNPKKKIIIKAIKKQEKVHISVKDFGVGLKKEDQDHLFKIGSSISTLGTNNEKGTGLGLILCKEFIERQGGEISIESRENAGTEVHFSLQSYQENDLPSGEQHD